ncbi:hypothetical protein B0H10DRAFT_2093298 [Mycena sp. CBHHK59/15]|nr:hypothetical protein B0H10DRAFT_2093298 [Mycena sp. CBHHK59/15]
MAVPRLTKSVSLLTTLASGLIHSVLAVHLLAAWRTLRVLDAESELDAWKLDGLRVLWALLALYVQAAAFISFVGFFGVLRAKPSHVRLYRDCSAADLACTAILTALAGYYLAAPGRCDQPELAQLLALLAPDETCERWLERAAVGLLVGLIVCTVARLHLLLAVSAHYAHLMRSSLAAQSHPQRIRLLPLPPSVSAADVVYAPVHVGTGVGAGAAEVWVSSAPIPTSSAEVQADAGLLDAAVVGVKREWI